MARQAKSRTIEQDDSYSRQIAETSEVLPLSELELSDQSVEPAVLWTPKPGDAERVHVAASIKATRQKQVSRTQQLLALLSRRQGAVNAEMLQLTGWQPHSLRAALSGLRKKGHVLERDHDRAGQLRYRLTKGPENTAVASRRQEA